MTARTTSGRALRRIAWLGLSGSLLLAASLSACGGEPRPVTTPVPPATAAPAAPPIPVRTVAASPVAPMAPAAAAPVLPAKPTSEPAPVLKPTPEPTPTARPIPEPTSTAKPMEAPTPDPVPTEKPTPGPAPATEPTPTAKPMEAPTPEPVPTEKPTPESRTDAPPGELDIDAAVIVWGDLYDLLSQPEQDCISSELDPAQLQSIRQEPVMPDDSSEPSEWEAALSGCLAPETAGAVLFSMMMNQLTMGMGIEGGLPSEAAECIRDLLADMDVGAILAASIQGLGSDREPDEALLEFALGMESCGAVQPGGMTEPSVGDYPAPRGDSVLWKRSVGAWVVNAPIVSNGVAYVGADDARVYALDAATGEPLWSFETGDVVRSPATVSDHAVYVGSNDNHLYALDVVTGALLWKHDTGDWVQYAPVVSGGAVYVPTLSSGDRRVHALDAASGTQIWAAQQGLPFTERFDAAVAGDKILAPGADGEINVLNAQTGEMAWSFRGDAGTDTRPVVVGDVVYLTAVNAAYALALSDGVVRWGYETGRFPARGFPPVLSDGIYYFSPDDHLYALDDTTGEPLWTYRLDAMASTGPVVAAGVVYVGTESGWFYALDRQTGDELWVLDPTAGMGMLESPSVSDGILYVESSEGYLLSLDAGTGELIWGFQKGFFSGVRTYTAVEGVIYVSSLGGAIYAISAPEPAVR